MREDPIIAKHPALFEGCFDFTPPKGWRGIVEALCDKLALTGCTVSQVKEKFGGLRVYLDNGTDAALAAVRDAEAQAARTCERCGADGAKRSGSWLRTLCEGCAK